MYFKLRNWQEARELRNSLAGQPRVLLNTNAYNRPTRTVNVILTGSMVFVEFNTRTPPHTGCYTASQALELLREAAQ